MNSFGKKGKKRVTIRITDTADVVVSAPLRYPVKHIEEFVVAHNGWIEEKRAFVQNLPAPLGPHTYETGDRFLVLGKEVVLKVQSCSVRKRVLPQLQENTLTVAVARPNQVAVRRAVLDFYRDLGQIRYGQAVAHWVECLELPSASRPLSIALVNYSARMGSCSKKRELRFALRSLMLSESLVDYLALHEVAHLAQFNHGSGFKNLLSIHMPDWKSRQSEISRLRNRTSRL